MTVAIAPLTTEHLPEAAALHDRWYARIRKALPHQSGRTVAPARGEELLGEILAEPRVEAVLARGGDGALTGYLAATPLDFADDDRAVLRAHPRSALVRYGGHALRGGREGVREDVLRGLYATVAARLVAERRPVHYVDLPADEELAAAWFRTGFGLERVRGLMAVRPRGRQPRGVDALSVRRAGPGDLDRIGRMAVEAARADRGTAVFRPQPEGAPARLRTSYADALADARCGAWVAARRGEEIGMVVLTPAAPGPVVDLGRAVPGRRPPAPAGGPAAQSRPRRDLAAVVARGGGRGHGPRDADRGGPAGVARGFHRRGAGRLRHPPREGHHGRAYDSGYRHITASWPVGSPVSAAHWPAVGFRPVAYRLQRVLDPRECAVPQR